MLLGFTSSGLKERVGHKDIDETVKHLSTHSTSSYKIHSETKEEENTPKIESKLLVWRLQTTQEEVL